MKKLIKWILPAPVLDRVRGIYMIVDYHLTVGRKRMGAKDLPGYGASLPAAPPFVTVYVTNSNNRDPPRANPPHIVRNRDVPQF